MEPLLRPSQVSELNTEMGQQEEMLANPNIADKGTVARNIRRIRHQLDTQSPKPYAATDLDAARRAEGELLEKIKAGMPTQAEMRKNPPGAVDKNRAWEKRNKPSIQEWKNRRLRLHASEASDIDDETDVANLERYRPVGGAAELAMDHAQISGTQYHLPPPGVIPTTLSADEIARLRDLAPDLAEKLAVMSADVRDEVKQLVASSETTKPSALAEFQAIRMQAKNMGINTRGMKKPAIEEAIKDKLDG